MAVDGSDGRVEIEGVEGRVVGLEILGKLPAPPNEGREPPMEGNPPAWLPIFGIEGRGFTFPNDGRDMFGALGLATLGMLGRDIFGIFGRAPLPPKCPIDGLAPPPPPIDGLAPPPPRPRWANAVGSKNAPIAKVMTAAVMIRSYLVTNMALLSEKCLYYLPAAGGSLTTVI